MLLAIDIGNTNIAIGVFQTSRTAGQKNRVSTALVSEVPKLTQSWRLSTAAGATADEYGTKILDLLHYAALERTEIRNIAIASVVPSLTTIFEELSIKYFRAKPMVATAGMKVHMPNLYENPKEVGADRLMNAVAGYAKIGGPCIIVDFGTATTFDCVTKKGEYAGGLIVPGPLLSAESLSLHTAKLPRVNIAKPAHLIGKNTVESIQSGLYYGYISLVDGIIDRLKLEMGANCKILATGGLAGLIAGESIHIKKEQIEPTLTLEGIFRVWERNVS